MAAITILGALFWVAVGLEAVYLWWLPAERPTRAARPLPSLVRGAIWAGRADLGCGPTPWPLAAAAGAGAAASS